MGFYEDQERVFEFDWARPETQETAVDPFAVFPARFAVNAKNKQVRLSVTGEWLADVTKKVGFPANEMSVRVIAQDDKEARYEIIVKA